MNNPMFSVLTRKCLQLIVLPPLLLPAPVLLGADADGPDSSRDQGEVTNITVTGFPWDYRAADAETAMKRRADIMDTAAAVQVVPAAVIEDQQALSLDHVLHNVSGTGFVDGGEGVQIFSRGFTAGTFKNGFALTEFTDGDVQRSHLDTYNVERVEVLKGPASVLYGRGNPGGTINIITKRPEEMASFQMGLQAGTADLGLRTTVDATGSLAGRGSARYRLAGFYEDNDSFRRFVESKEYGIAPSLAFDLSPGTTATLLTEFAREEALPDGGLPGVNGEVRPDVSREAFLGEPGDRREDERQSAQLLLDHDFGGGWTWRSVLRTESSDSVTEFARPSGVQEDGRTVQRGYVWSEFGMDDYRFQSQVDGEFSTGRVVHNLVAGVEAGRRETNVLFAGGPIGNVDLYNPQYGAEPREPFFTFVSAGERSLAGAFFQDQMSLDEAWHFVAGGRFDVLEQEITSGLLGNTSAQPVKDDEAFSPNAGLVYRPVEEIALYANWSRSFQTQNGVPLDAAGKLLEPQEAMLLEAGVKFSLLNDRLGGTVALYDIDKENSPTPDLDNPGFQLALGEVESRGLEMDIAGSVRPGWRVIAAYAYNDAEVLRDPRPDLLGKRPKEMPRHSGNLWTTYEVTRGELAGLGFGGGLTYVGRRPGNDANTFDLPGYARLDATLFYRQERFTARLNVYNLLDEDIVANMARGSFVRPGQPLTARASIQVNF